MKRPPWLLALLFATTCWSVTPHAVAAKKQNTQRIRTESTGPSYAKHPQAQAWAADMARKHGIPLSWWQKALGQAKRNASVIQLMSPAPSGFQKNWHVYRSRFIEPRRIAAGVAFWDAQSALLEQVAQREGVAAEIIVGILGVETIYGRDTGKFRVLDALSTLAFDFPQQHPRASQRQAYFREELEQFLLQSQGSKQPLKNILGSYAGAMGWPQFMPGSVTRFAVDGDGDGRIDLHHTMPDILASVANYFKVHGWQSGLPTHYGVRFEPTQSDAQKSELLTPDILPSFSPQRLQELGVGFDPSWAQHPGKLALIELKNGDEPPSYVLGTENFYVITRYNWSAYYAMAVIELGQAVAAARAAR